MTYCLDVELFIKEVHKYPEIWDFTKEDNRFQKKKQDAWDKIARIFIADFDDMPKDEKIDVYRKLHGKWRNIRDSFVRNMKRPGGKKSYMYAKHLSFLHEVYNKDDNQESDEEADNDNDSSLPWHSDNGDQSKLKKEGKKKLRFTILNDENVWANDVNDSPSIIDNLKRRRTDHTSTKQENTIEFVDTPFPDATSTSNCYSIEDEDRSFFESLLPVVRRFDIDQKLEFRSQVINLIKNIRSGNCGGALKILDNSSDLE